MQHKAFNFTFLYTGDFVVYVAHDLSIIGQMSCTVNLKQFIQTMDVNKTLSFLSILQLFSSEFLRNAGAFQQQDSFFAIIVCPSK